MKPPGVDLLVAARSALLDALEALSGHRDAVIVIGAQAIYLHSGRAQVALAEATKDSDLAIDPRGLADEPLIEEAMIRFGFRRNTMSVQPGSWLNESSVPVDLMVPEAFAGPGGRTARAARIPPHANIAARRARGLEAVLVDNVRLEIAALEPGDRRKYSARVAGPAALLVAKVFKISERRDTPGRLVDKDAHDIYRLLSAVEASHVAASLNLLTENPVSRTVTEQALDGLQTLFADGPEALGSVMAGRAEEGVGDPAITAASVAFLVSDVLSGIRN